MRLAELLVEFHDPRNNSDFRKWFGASKIVDDNGRPLPVYHGTDRAFKQFSTDFVGSRTDSGFFGRGFYFIDDTEWASSYAEFEAKGTPNVHACYLRMIKPYTYRNDVPDGDWRDPPSAREQRIKDFTAKIRHQGHDGIIVHGGISDTTGQRVNEYVVFDPDQIRSVFEFV